MAALLTGLLQHRDYVGSVEQSSGLAPEADQVFTAAEINALIDGIDDHAPLIDAIKAITDALPTFDDNAVDAGSYWSAAKTITEIAVVADALAAVTLADDDGYDTLQEIIDKLKTAESLLADVSDKTDDAFSYGVTALTRHTSGSGSPEGVEPAAMGTLYGRTDIGQLWYKASGAYNTGWVNSQDRTTHTGTQLLSTISDAGALAALSTVSTTEIDDDAVTYAKLQNVAADGVILGNVAGAGSVVDELTATEVRTLLNIEDGALARPSGTTAEMEAHTTALLWSNTDTGKIEFRDTVTDPWQPIDTDGPEPAVSYDPLSYAAMSGVAVKEAADALQVNIDTVALKADATYSTVADLVADTLDDGKFYVTQGYYSIGDGGGNAYRFVGGSTATVDGGFVLSHADGRLIAIRQDRTTTKQYGAKHDNSTNDFAAVQAAFNSGAHVLIEGGTAAISPGVGEQLIIPEGVSVQFKSYLRYVGLVRVGSFLEVSKNCSVINPLLDGTGTTIVGSSGNNGLSIGTGAFNVQILGGEIKGFPRGNSAPFDGGKAIQAENSPCSVLITGTKIANCHMAISSRRDALNGVAGEGGIHVKASGITATNCNIGLFAAVMNATYQDGIEHSVSLSDFTFVDCGTLGDGYAYANEGVFSFSRAAHVTVSNGTVSGTNKIDAIIRGRVRNSSFKNIVINQPCIAALDIDPTYYGIDTSQMTGNTYDFSILSAYDYLYKSDLTDTTYSYRILTLCSLTALCKLDATILLVTPATRNGNFPMKLSYGHTSYEGVPGYFNGKQFSTLPAVVNGTVIVNPAICTPNLPTTAPTIVGSWWNDAGTLKIKT